MKTFEQIFSVVILGIVVVFLIFKVISRFVPIERILKKTFGAASDRLEAIVSSIDNKNFKNILTFQILIAAEVLLWIPVLISSFYTYNISMSITFFALLNFILLSALFLGISQGLFAGISTVWLINSVNIIHTKLEKIFAHAKRK